jgi:prepilin-type N-terminal cleavage/methylation domain-containing protein
MKMKMKFFDGGFTIIEMMMSLFIFSLIFGAVSSLFVSAIRSQSRALASQQILKETSYVIEYMGRAMRMAQKDDIEGGSCLPGDKVNFATTISGIRFKNYEGQCQEFFRVCSGGICQLKEKKEKSDGTLISENYLTSPNLDVVSFNIGGGGWGQDDSLQPRVTMFLEIKKAGPGPQPKIKIQTTISQRGLDVER